MIFYTLYRHFATNWYFIQFNYIKGNKTLEGNSN